MDYQRLQRVYAKYEMRTLDVKVGQLVEIHEEIGEGDTKRIWKFKWLILKTWKSKHPDGTFTIRGVSSGITIEKVYPLSCAKLQKIILLDEYKRRTSKLYYLRYKLGKDARMKSKITAERRWIDLTGNETTMSPTPKKK